MIRVVLADDHAILRAGLAELFAAQPDMAVIGQAGSAETLVEVLRREPPDVLLLDLNMPGESGPVLLGRIRQLWPSLPVLVLTMHGSPSIVQRSLEQGARGFLSKGCDIQTLMTAVRKLAAGERFVESALAQRMVLDGPGDDEVRLTRREQEVLALIVAGMRLGDIADRLFLSAKTVSTHKMNLMRKLDVDNNADLIRLAMRQGLDM
ncbi:response regulator [Sphaerotilus mobilis]|uniref:LuxR family two component transcriptional regulator n=1 Tax=Sphaerotilus mobilis TaxID=47994 RepID=A0A4Q7LVF0_9BURK|nr:response regulator transcription factor [Sphaerotilus mobilis]RZS58282.1 LuxR family two component transcriptional regulator [Sphaerotilus mobilis]